MVVLVSVLLFADAADDAFLHERLDALAKAYEQYASRHTNPDIRARISILREIGHLPFEARNREEAGRIVARVLTEDRSYRVRAEAARTAAKIGTARSVRALYRALFGEEGRSHRFALLHTLLPEALAALHHPDGIEWIGKSVLGPAARGRNSQMLSAAGPLRETLVAATLEGLGRGHIRLLVNEIEVLARDESLAVRVAAVRALAALDRGDKTIAAAAADPDPRVRAAIAGFPRLTAEQCRRALADAAPGVRRAMIEALCAHPPTEAVPLLVARLGQESDAVLRMEIAEALNKLSGKEFGTDALLWRSWWDANRESFTGPQARDRSGHRYFFDVPLRTRRVLFVLDISNSMGRRGEDGRTRQARAGAELAHTLASLPPGTQFALIAFSGSTRRWPEKLPQAGARKLGREAQRWYLDLHPAGATNTYAALMEAVIDPLRPDTIVLLSDGNPYHCTYRGRNYSEHEQILAEVRRVNRERRIRIHTVALLAGARRDDKEEDAAAAADFLRRLADQNRGEFREVR